MPAEVFDVRDMSHIGEISVNHPRHLVNVVDLSATGWKEVASHEVFTVTGAVDVIWWLVCTENVAGTGELHFGNEDDTAAFGYVSATDFTAGTMYTPVGGGSTSVAAWYQYPGSGTYETFGFGMFRSYGKDFGFENKFGGATTNGTLEFHCIWEPLLPGASVVIGAGGSL